MEIERNKRFKKIFDSIHDDVEPSFYWQFHHDMRYWYNENINSIECDCGLIMPITLKDEELNERNLWNFIREMENKIYSDYLNMDWDIGYWDD